MLKDRYGFVNGYASFQLTYQYNNNEINKFHYLALADDERSTCGYAPTVVFRYVHIPEQLLSLRAVYRENN